MMADESSSTAIYGGAFSSSSATSYAEVVQKCFGGLAVGSCAPTSPNWLNDFLEARACNKMAFVPFKNYFHNAR